MANCETCQGTGEVVSAISRYGAPSRCGNCGGTGVEPKPTEFWGEHIAHVRCEERERVLREIEAETRALDESGAPAVDWAYCLGQIICRLREGA